MTDYGVKFKITADSKNAEKGFKLTSQEMKKLGDASSKAKRNLDRSGISMNRAQQEAEKTCTIHTKNASKYGKK